MASVFSRLLSRWIPHAPGSDELRRNRLVAMMNGVATSLGNRLLSVLIGFVSVPLTIGYLGTERYGAWIAIGAILSWVALADLGLGNGLTNALTSAASRGRPDLVRMHISNFLFLMTLLCMATAGLVALAWPFIRWESVLGIADPAAAAEVRIGLAVALALFLARFPFTAANRVYIAYQEGHVGNYWGAAGNILSLAALIVVTQTKGGLPWLVFALSGVSLLVEMASTLWLFGRRRPMLRPGLRHVDRAAFGEVLKVGTQFFLIQIMALVTFQTDVLVIAHFRGSASVPTYNLTYQLFNYATLPQALLFQYLWAAYNEAIARGDIAWVRKALKWNILGGLAWSAAAVTVLALIAKPFIAWWAGASLIPTTPLILWMAAWVLINAVTNTIACLLAAASHLRYQLVYSAFATVSNLVLSILLVNRVGITGVIAATVLSYLIFICGPVGVDVRFLLRRLERERAR
jgi:O-antigen/teichoic acid export membrane protein